jgi:hypothetical protein
MKKPLTDTLIRTAAAPASGRVEISDERCSGLTSLGRQLIRYIIDMWGAIRGPDRGLFQMDIRGIKVL